MRMGSSASPCFTSDDSAELNSDGRPRASGVVERKSEKSDGVLSKQAAITIELRLADLVAFPRINVIPSFKLPLVATQRIQIPVGWGHAELDRAVIANHSLVVPKAVVREGGKPTAGSKSSTTRLGSGSCFAPPQFQAAREFATHVVASVLPNATPNLY